MCVNNSNNNSNVCNYNSNNNLLLHVNKGISAVVPTTIHSMLVCSPIEHSLSTCIHQPLAHPLPFAIMRRDSPSPSPWPTPTHTYTLRASSTRTHCGRAAHVHILGVQLVRDLLGCDADALHGLKQLIKVLVLLGKLRLL